MFRPSTVPLLLILGMACFSPLFSQQSASYRVEQHALNAGGVPTDGQIHTSANFAITLESIAGPVGTFVLGGAPPTEVTGLLFTDGDTLIWDGHLAAGEFRLYRDDLASLGAPFGNCFDTAIAVPTADDAANPAPNTAFVYFVNVANTLGEEGSAGYSSAGLERIPAAVCP